MKLHRQRAKLVAAILLGPAALFASLLIPAPSGLGDAGWQTLAMALWMASWWVLEIIPVPATALLPLLSFPLLGLSTIKDTAQAYSHPVIFLFLGGFLLGIALQHWNLHRRLALLILLQTGAKPIRQLAGFMLATAFLSMWVSNTATAIMMLPIALSVIALQRGEQQSRFATALLLAIAYSANIGGIATLIGTPPNALLAAFLQTNHGIELGFARWLMLGLPISMTMLLICGWWLSRDLRHIPEQADSAQTIRQQLQELGRISPAEQRVLAVFMITALLWIFRPVLSDGLPGLSDASIALLAGLMLFILPSASAQQPRLLDWPQAQALPWGILLLFGGGLALAGGIQSSGLADWLTAGLNSVAALPSWALVLMIVTVIIFLTELTSNTATTASFLPLLAAFALAQHQSVLLFTVPAAVAASCAFMMPVATPPNAVVFGSGRIEITEMLRHGLVLNLFGAVVVAAIAYGLVLAFWL